MRLKATSLNQRTNSLSIKDIRDTRNVSGSPHRETHHPCDLPPARVRFAKQRLIYPLDVRVTEFRNPRELFGRQGWKWLGEFLAHEMRWVNRVMH